MFEGIAKPMPCAYADLTVDWLMPMTWPSMSISGPPELPGLIGAEVCSRPLKSMTPPFSVGIGSSRLKAETTPTVTVCCSSSGSPMAIAHCPCSQLVGVGELERRRKLGVVVDLDDRQVGADVARDDVRRHVVAVGEDDRHLADCAPVRRLNDVRVGDDVALVVDTRSPSPRLAPW